VEGYGVADLISSRRPRRASARRNFDALSVAADAALTEFGAEASMKEIAKRAGVGGATPSEPCQPSREATYAIADPRSPAPSRGAVCTDIDADDVMRLIFAATASAYCADVQSERAVQIILDRIRLTRRDPHQPLPIRVEYPEPCLVAAGTHIADAARCKLSLMLPRPPADRAVCHGGRHCRHARRDRGGSRNDGRCGAGSRRCEFVIVRRHVRGARLAVVRSRNRHGRPRGPQKGSHSTSVGLHNVIN
jgi:hypothetical protein